MDLGGFAPLACPAADGASMLDCAIASELVRKSRRVGGVGSYPQRGKGAAAGDSCECAR